MNTSIKVLIYLSSASKPVILTTSKTKEEVAKIIHDFMCGMSDCLILNDTDVFVSNNKNLISGILITLDKEND